MYPIYTLALYMAILLATSSVSGASDFDTYRGYRAIKSPTYSSHTGMSKKLKAHQLIDPSANFPPNGLVGTYLHPNASKPFVPVTRRTRYLEALRYRIVRNTRTELFTDPADGPLTQHARSGDTYKTSGFFQVEKLGARWWYITPEGHAFIALSVSVVNPNGKDGQNKDGKVYGDYVKAKYGGEKTYRANWANATIDRLQRWGFNAIGTFSHKIQTQPYLTQRLPHVITLRLSNRAVIDKAVGNIWNGVGGGKFPDLWHPAFHAYIDQRMKQLATAERVRDPYILYLFPDQADELRGIGAHHYSLGWAALVGKREIDGHPNYTKLALRDFMQAQYDNIKALNAGWKTAYTTWDSDGGYGQGRGFLDQDKKGVPGPTYKALAKDAPAAMQADLDAFTEHLLRRYAKSITSTIRRYDPNHLIVTPNGVSLKTAVKAFDGYFDLIWAQQRWAYDLLQEKRPLATSSLGYLSAERDSPLRLEGQLSSRFELQTIDTDRGPRRYIKLWDTDQDFWFNLKGGHPLHVAFFDAHGKMLNFGKAPGNRFDILATGNDTHGGWMQLRSRGFRAGTVEELAHRLRGKEQHAYCKFSNPTAQPASRARGRHPFKQWMRDIVCQALPDKSVSPVLYYRRRGQGNPNSGQLELGYNSQADRARAWKEGLHRDLTEQAANGDYFRVGANWWKLSDNGWTYWLERYNFGLVTLKDNAYDGREATILGADGQRGTDDDETHDYGDLLTGMTQTNTGLYPFLQQHDATPSPRH